MTKKNLADHDPQIIGECLDAAADGPFFPDWEFQTLFGLTREEVRLIAQHWPDMDWCDDNVRLAVNNSLNHLIGYPHRVGDGWSDWVSVDRDELPAVLARWRGNRPKSYFDGLR